MDKFQELFDLETELDEMSSRVLEIQTEVAPLRALPGRCEEASPMSHTFYIPCNSPASCKVVWYDHDGFVREGPVRMCEPCGWHNVNNRGAKYVCEEAE